MSGTTIMLNLLRFGSKYSSIRSHSSRYGGIDTIYTVGNYVSPDSYDPDIRIDCTNGIHVFLTRKEAVEF